MKYKLINQKTKEEHLCDKVTIGEFDYYIVNKEPTLSDTLNTCYYIFNNILYKREYSHHKGCKKVIATNNPNIDIPKVVDEVDYECMKDQNGGINGMWVKGYNKSQETHPFSEDDMIRFGKHIVNLCLNNIQFLVEGELLEWKEQQPKIVYYE